MTMRRFHVFVGQVPEMFWTAYDSEKSAVRLASKLMLTKGRARVIDGVTSDVLWDSNEDKPI